ncbi:MAG: MliC family protein [Zoogloeaceae bacterium]|nr:MliC family protein [Zoogloeaceae bacterium]
MSKSSILAAGCSGVLYVGLSASAASPSPDCIVRSSGSVAALVCSDDELAALERRLAETLAATRHGALRRRPRRSQTDQAQWLASRDACWKSPDLRRCTLDSYRLRIAELQARYRLAPHTGSRVYACEGAPADTVVVTWFDTDPPSLMAERGEEASLMFLQPSASGSRYVGDDESLWEWHGRTRIVWGYRNPEMQCKVKP